MALLDSRQLNPRLTGSFTLSGSLATDSASTGPFGRLDVSGDSSLLGNLTIGGNIQIGDSTGDSITITADLTSNLIPNTDNTYDLGTSTKNWRYGYIEQVIGDSVTTSGNVSGSATSTGSFGTLETSYVITVGANKKIYLNRSEDTYIQSLTGDIARTVAGGKQMLLLDKDTGLRAVFGNGVKVYIGADDNKQPDKELVVDGDISGSATSTGSFGTLETSGEINASGRIYEAGSSVIDHATAMAIVFGG